ncbi:hypothetical protein E2C01_063650 [Portunus trituberculatus]|uniref:Uncharacterized protein n=1 Tax=Portunus trituberculatus TaxID=210409 RepID=A0A5B7HIQ4_PORTR|nr:hypothetical protein [Portunus trituberculatus]
MAKTVIKQVQDNTQEFDQEVEEVIRLGRYSEGGRPMKVKMRSQVAVEEIMVRKGKLADDVDLKEMWIKRDMNLEEREKQKVLRSEAKEKKQEKDRDREEEFLLEGSGYETKEKRGGHEGGNKLRVTHSNIVDGLLSSILEVLDYLKEKKPDVMCIVETKLKKEIYVNFKEEEYNTWKNKGGGVLITVRDNICVGDVQYGEDKVEVMGVTIRTEDLKKRKIIVTCSTKD